MRLSVTVITLNEEAHIVPCLESVRFADEIVVVDSGSTDRTMELARNFTDRIFHTHWQGFAGTKNFALEQASGDWVFSLDADKRVPDGLHREIISVVKEDGPSAGYKIPRKNYVGGRWIRHLGWYPDHTLRLFRRGQWPAIVWGRELAVLAIMITRHNKLALPDDPRPAPNARKGAASTIHNVLT